MKVIEHINQRKNKTLFSFEILPPLKGKDVNSIYESIDPLLEFNPSYVNVTYHRQEFIYKKREKGYLEKIAVRKRPGTVGICAAIKFKYGIDAVPHLICGGFSKEETENALIDLNFLGIENVLALRGDAIKSERDFKASNDGHHYASDLLSQIVELNNGKYLDPDLQQPSPTNFCIGVAGYPEKHFEAPNLKTDLSFLRKKVELGAEYIVTQMFFDNKKYFEFVDLCRAEGITIPIIPGLKPITTARQTSILPSIFHIDLPEDLADAILKCKNNDEVKMVGVEWSIAQSKELLAQGVPVLHYYSMGKSTSLQKIAKALF